MYYNPYKYEYDQIKFEYSTKSLNKYEYDLINSVLNSKQLPDEFYQINHMPKTINTTNGIKILPYPIAIIIMYYRENELINLMKMSLKCISNNMYSLKFKKFYEPRAEKIREKYNKLIDYYHEEYKNKLSK